ncbi:hypothetical protein K2X85_01885 [bacterium]|nr:hypothetical protein [bacterium]
MTNASDTDPRTKQMRRRLRRFDSISAMLEAALTLTGAAVLVLLTMFIANRVWPSRKPAQAMEVLQIAVGEEEGMAGDNPELGEGALPSAEELPMRDGSLDFEDNDVLQTLSSVLDAAANSEIDLSDPSQRSGQPGSGRPGLPGGEGKEGSGRGKGGIPNHSRWDIRYPSQSLSEYAAALDFFGIELGVVRGKELTLVSQLARGNAVIRKGAATESRLFFQWQDNARRKADIDLLREKGVATAGAIVVQFFSTQVEQQLAALEKQEAKQPIARIRKTEFGVRSSENKTFEFYVIGITYIR